jgi:hypothetical protein
LARQQLEHKIGPGGPVQLERDARIQAIKDAYVVDEAKAEELFNKQLAQQLMLRNVAPGGAGERATREMLTASFNNYRAMLGLPEMPSPFTAGRPTAETPTQTQAAPHSAGMIAGVGIGGAAGNVVYNFYGTTLGTLGPAATAINDYTSRQEDTYHALGAV